MPFTVSGTAGNGEAVVLDPTAVSTNRTELDITNYINIEGIDWGDAQITQYLAEADRGSLPVAYTVPNRIVTIPLVLKDIGGTDFHAIRQSLQAKAALFQREGGKLSRTTTIGTYYADVVNATLRYGGDWYQANRDFDRSASLVLECLPDFYGDEVTLDDITETTLPEITRVLQLTGSNATVKGDYPARVRVVIDDDEGQNQLGLIWGFRSRNYSNAATTALAYEAEALTPISPAASTAVAGSSGSNSVQHASLATNWTPVLSTQIAASGHMTHVGSYRVWVRARTTSSTPPLVRLVWDVGDLLHPVPNDSARIPGTNNFYPVDLGTVTLAMAPVGAHRWQGVIQALGTVGGENIQIDRVWLQPLDEAAGTLAAPLSTDPGLTGYSARDEFNQTSGSLATKTLPVGGTWSGAGDTDDFTVNGSDATLQRTATGDASDLAGRFAIAGTTNFTNIAVQVDMKTSGVGGFRGPFARYTDTSNWLRIEVNVGSDTTVIALVQNVAATTTTLAFTVIPTTASGVWWRFRIVTDTRGMAYVWRVKASGYGSLGDPLLTVQSSALATGGALATGKVGIYDSYTGGAALTRSYDNFAAWVPDQDAVIFASQSCELRWDGPVREDAAGAAYGPVSLPLGALPRLPPSGIENRPVEVFLKATRSDLDAIADAGIDNVSARVYYRPSWLLVPGS